MKWFCKIAAHSPARCALRYASDEFKRPRGRIRKHGYVSEAYSKPYKTSKMEHSAKIINGFSKLYMNFLFKPVINA